MNGSQLSPVWSATGAALGWFAVIAQYYLIQTNRIESVAETTIRFFSYFTILTNILVACMFTARLFRETSSLRAWFQKPTVFTGITLSILVVGIVYQVILRHIWQPAGLQQVVDEILHTVMPLYAITCWWLGVPKKSLVYSMIPAWLVYPFLYLCFVLLRGHASGFYPYPFLHVDQLGWNNVLLNATGVMVLFIMLSLILVAIKRRK